MHLPPPPHNKKIILTYRGINAMLFNYINFLNEGEQAEEYKKRKAEEAAKKEQEEKEREERRYGGLEEDQHHRFVGNQRHTDKKFSDMSDSEQDRYTDKMGEDERRASAAAYVANKNRNNPNSNFNRDFDTINKDMRRHPDRWKKEHDSDRISTKRESSIFESVKFI